MHRFTTLVAACALLAAPSNAFAQTVEASLEANVEPMADDTPSDNHELGEALWITGLTVFSATYVLTGVTATTMVYLANTRDVTIAESWIPLAGPWIMLGDSSDFDALQLAGTAISGVLQLAALATFIAGVVLVNEPRRPATALVVAPAATPDFGGLVMAGSF